MRLNIFICAVLFGVTLALYWPARHFDIIYYDDPLYYMIPQLAQGLNSTGIEWAMTGVVSGNWQPVTSFSFLLGRQWWGSNPGAEHMVNVFFHAANAVLVYLVMVRLTTTPIRAILPHPDPLPLGEGESSSDGLKERRTQTGGTPVLREHIWPCAFVAAVFAWHPLRVESVAWITERKDVLFLFFMLLTLMCYVRYARAKDKAINAKDRASAMRGFQPEVVWYLLALVFFGLSFMSKAMVVTLPFLLLLLDFWPLGRFHQGSTESRPTQLIIEKIPFFALTILFCSVTYQVQKSSGAVATLQEMGFAGRVENATLNYIYYIGKFFWPTKLALLYPYPKSFDVVQVMLAGLQLLAITALCLLQLSRRPYLAVGWFWYLGTMVPVIGLVQIGEAAMADRYTYLPMIGPVMSLTWLIVEWAGTNSFRKHVMVSAGVVALCACMVLTRTQVMFWQNTATLFGRTAAVAPENGMAQFPLAQGLQQEGLLRQAAVHYRMAIAMPNVFHYLAHLNFAMLLQQMGYYQEADEHYETALKIVPISAIALNNLSWMLATCPDPNVRNGARAVELGEQICQLTDYKATLSVGTLAAAYAEAGRFDDAVSTAQLAITLAQEHGEGTLLKKNKELLQLYLAHKAYHEPKIVPGPK